MIRSATRWFAVCALVGGAAAVWLVPTVAGAQTSPNYPVNTTATTSPCTTTTPGGVCADGTAPPSVTVETTSLAFTGGDLALVTILGLVIVGAGVVLLRLGRRRSGSPA